MKVINFSKRQQIVSKINFTFDEKIKTNFYTTDYFLKAKNVLNNKNTNELQQCNLFVSIQHHSWCVVDMKLKHC